MNKELYLRLRAAELFPLTVWENAQTWPGGSQQHGGQGSDQQSGSVNTIYWHLSPLEPQ